MKLGVEALRHLGQHYKELEANGIQMPVYDLAYQFIRLNNFPLIRYK